MPSEKILEIFIKLFIKTPAIMQSSDTEKKVNPKEYRIGYINK